MSTNENGQAGASPNKAQGIVNLAPGEKAPTQIDYPDYEKQLQDISDQLKTAGSHAEIDAIGKKIADIEAEVAKYATKKALTQKINQLSKKMSESAEAVGKQGEAASCKSEKDGDGNDGDGDDGEDSKPQQAKVHGKGIINREEDETKQDPQKWFKELFKANVDSRKQQGTVSFVGQKSRQGIEG